MSMTTSARRGVRRAATRGAWRGAPGGSGARRLGATERGEHLASVANRGAELGRRHHQHAVLDPLGAAGENERGHIGQLLFSLRLLRPSGVLRRLLITSSHMHV